MEEQNGPKKSILGMWWFWVIISVFALFVLAMIATPSTPSQTTQNTTITSTIQQPTNTPTPTPLPPFVFDVPALLGKNVDEVASALKEYQTKTLPVTDQQIKMGVKDWDIEFEKEGKTISVSYVIATKKINDFFIESDDPSGATKDKKHLLELGNLSETDPRYSVEFVKTLKDPTVFTGVIVTPK